jgi:RNA polymerase sigma-70 factor (ECF subfamily)
MNQVYAEIVEVLPDLRRYALTLNRNPTAADDLIQDCVLRALVKCHLFNAGSNLRAWLFTIMHNVHISSVRRGKHIELPIDPDLAAARLWTKPAQEEALLMKALFKAMQDIPEAQRNVVLMVGVEGLSYEAIAERLQVRVGTVKSRASRGRDALRKALHGKDAYEAATVGGFDSGSSYPGAREIMGEWGETIEFADPERLRQRFTQAFGHLSHA